MPKRKAPPEKGHDVVETSADGDSDAPNNKKMASEEAVAPSDTEGTRKTTNPQTDEPPPYGTQEYWENRYAESASAGHSWYFTYDELRPLLLPLLLGRDDTGSIVDGDDEDNGGEYEEWVEDENDDEEEKESTEGETKDEEEIKEEEEEDDEEDEGISDQCDQAGAGRRSNDIDDDDTQHVQEEHPPKSVLEVGCGDVPLGHALLLDLLSMQRGTGADANLVVKEIVCNDYAKSVIDVLRERQKQHWECSCVRGSYKTAEGRDGRKIERLALCKATQGDKEPADRPTLDVTYVVDDARDMAYNDDSFDLIIDKGTTDALLSDKEEGINNCVKVVGEMGRCVTVGGFIMVVSHMNAHCDAGIDWCDKVLLAGLRASRADASWEIEVHGSDGSEAVQNVYDEKDGNRDNNEEGNNDGNPSGSPGPAVYIIHKLPPKPKPLKANKAASVEAVIDTIPLKFFTY